MGFDITTDKSWTAEASDSWIKISQEAGNGSTYMRVTILENPNFYTGRHGSVTIKTEKKFYVVDIFQSGSEYPVLSEGDVIISEKDTIFLSSEAQTKILTVKSDVSVSVEEVRRSYSGWLNISPGETTAEGNEILITAEENGTYHTNNCLRPPRSWTLRLKAGDVLFEYEIKQNSQQFKESGDLGLSVEWATYDVGANNSSERGKTYNESELQALEKDGWRLPTIKDWEELYNNCKKYYREEYLDDGEGYHRVPAVNVECVAKNGNSIKFMGNYYWTQEELKPTSSSKTEEKPVKSESGDLLPVDYGDYIPSIYKEFKYFNMRLESWYCENNHSQYEAPVRLVRDKK